MKVKVLDNKWSHIHYEGKRYKTDEVLDIKEKDFDPKVFKKVGKSPEMEEPEYTGGPSPALLTQAGGVPPSPIKTEVTVRAEEPAQESVAEERKSTRKRRRKIPS